MSALCSDSRRLAVLDEEVAGERDGAGLVERAVRGLAQVGGRLDAHHLGRLDQAIGAGRDARAMQRARAVVILASHGHTAHAALGAVVVERDEGESPNIWK